jgi:hypothetical protein
MASLRRDTSSKRRENATTDTLHGSKHEEDDDGKPYEDHDTDDGSDISTDR